MEQGLLKKSAIKNNLMWIVILGVICGGLSFFGYQNIDYLKSLIKPIVLQQEENYDEYYEQMLPPITNLDELYILNTYFYLYEQETPSSKERKTDGIYLTQLGNKMIICVYPSTADEDPDVLLTEDMVGYIKNTSEVDRYSELLLEVIKDFNSYYGTDFTEEDFAPKVLYMESKSNVIVNYIVTGAIVIFGVAMIIYLIKYVIYLINFKGMKGIRHLKKYGEITSVIDEIESEQPIYAGKGQMITENWIVSTKLNTCAVKLENIIWVYTKLKGISEVQYYALYIHTKDGNKFVINTLTEMNHTQVLNQLKEMIPWIYYGETSQTHNLWKKQRQIMLDEIEANKKIISLNQIQDTGIEEV